MIKTRIIAALVLLSAVPAWAADAPAVSDVLTILALNSSTAVCLGANGYRRALVVDNTVNTATVGFCETQGGSSQCTPAIGTVGTQTIPASTWIYWAAGSAPQNQICFIASTGTPSISIREGE